MSEELELGAIAGFIEPRVQAEFPGLRLDWLTAEPRTRSSPAEVRDRLRQLSSRYRGANVVAMRTQPIAHAYRAFFRQIGLDPDIDRIPSEQAAVDRLLHGQFRSRNLLEDALLIAVVETGIPVWALSGRLLDPSGLGIRTTVAGDRLGTTEYAHFLAPGRLVVADAHNVHALLFGDLAPGHGVTGKSEPVALFSVAVEGVPAIAIEEALWVCIDVLKCG